jgi:curli biogenesis system outer membrane secretion channel CsgG
VFATFVAVAGCATQTPKVEQVESSHSLEQQKQAQAAAVTERDQAKLALKRKVALGRITNETTYGRSLLLDKHDDVLGKQVTDMLSKNLTESGNFLVFERPDIGRLKDEQALTGQAMQLVGVDTLIIGSLTEFGRNTTGETAFLSDSKKQKAYAKVDLRLVDSKTGFIYHTVSGAGEASTESSAIAGFGSKASYDGALNDRAIASAVTDAVGKLTGEILRRSWQTDILSIEGDTLYISGGRSQGIRPGMQFTIKTRGQQVKSGQTGFNITLPGKTVASVKVLSSFGNTEMEEGSIVAIEQGSIGAYTAADLVIVEKE